MRKEENIGHIALDKRAITSLLPSYLISVTVIQHLSRAKITRINFFLQVIIKFYF